MLMFKKIEFAKNGCLLVENVKKCVSCMQITYCQPTVIQHVVGFAVEAELTALFYNCKKTVPHQVSLAEIGHSQPKTVVTTNKSSVHGLINKTISLKAVKSMDLCFRLLKCRQALNHFVYQWQHGNHNLSGYHTKQNPSLHCHPW